MLKQYNKVLVTGGLRFIGSHLVKELRSLGKDVTIADNFDTALHKAPKGTRLIKADVRKPEEIAAVVKGAS